MTPFPLVLAVAGTGPAATSFLCQLARQVEDRASRAGIAEVQLFEPPGNGGPVGAGSDLPCARLADLSAVHGDPGHALRWALGQADGGRLDARSSVPTVDSCLSQAQAERYLQHAHREALDRLRTAGIAVRRIAAPVHALRRTGRAHELRTASGETHRADLVALSLEGAGAGAFDHLRSMAGYVTASQAGSAAGGLPSPHAAVCILGSGAAALRAALALHAAGHRGRLTLVSRHGRLPQVRGDHARPGGPTRFTRAHIERCLSQRHGSFRLDDFARLLIRELSRCGASPGDFDDGAVPPSTAEAFGHFAASIDAARSRPSAWQGLADDLEGSLDLVWHQLPPAQRHIFDRDFKPQWRLHGETVPLAEALAFLELVQAGRIHLLPGRAEVAFDPGTRGYAVQVAAGRRATLLGADLVVDATAPSDDATRCRSALVRGMLATGMARAHAFGGIEVDFASGQIVTRDGTVSQGVHVLGDLVGGTYFCTRPMAVKARLAAQAVHSVLGQACDAQARRLEAAPPAPPLRPRHVATRPLRSSRPVAACAALGPA